MTPENKEPQSETTELREQIAALDAELTEDFKAQFSVAHFYLGKSSVFREIKTNPPIVGINTKKPSQQALLNISSVVTTDKYQERCLILLLG